MPVKGALEMAKKNKAEIVDLKFVDFRLRPHPGSSPCTSISNSGLRTRAETVKNIL
jgi:hypothetical protein